MKFIIYENDDTSDNQRYGWSLLNDNDDTIANGGELFLKQTIKKSIKNFQNKVNDQTPIFDNESQEDVDKGYRFEYEKQDDKFYWKMRAANNKTIAKSDQGLETKDNMLNDIYNIKANILGANIEYEDDMQDPSYHARQSDLTKNKDYIPAGSYVNNSLKKLLDKGFIDYKEIMSNEIGLTKNTGAITVIKNYFPEDNDSLEISIFLSFRNESEFENKCWLPYKIIDENQSMPSYHEDYEQFQYENIQYYPYSISISTKPIEVIFEILNGLHMFCERGQL